MGARASPTGRAQQALCSDVRYVAPHAMAAEFKDKGNDAYKAANYVKAVEFYTSGIENEPSNAALFSNRSAAYLKLEDYAKARRDAEMCIQLDSSWSKVRCILSSRCRLKSTNLRQVMPHALRLFCIE